MGADVEGKMEHVQLNVRLQMFSQNTHIHMNIISGNRHK